jgi:hypothetical protein
VTKTKLSGFAAAFAALAAAIVASRGGASKPHPQPPPAPQVYALGVHLFDGDPAKDEKIPGATLTLQERTARTDGAGNAVFVKLDAGTYHVCAAAGGFVSGCADATLPGADLNLSLARDVPPVGPLAIEGKRFTNGWQWRGYTAFTLLKRSVEGEDIGPYLDDVRSQGANLVRVLTTMRNIAPFPPSAYTDAQLVAFLGVVHAHGLRAELVALADATDWPIDAQRRQVQRVIDAAAAAGAVDLVEVANEPFKNSAPPEAIMRGVQRRPGVLLASGDYTITSGGVLYVLDYLTYHAPRDGEWPRKAKDGQDYRDGFGDPSQTCDDCFYEGAKRPVVGDEPIGADEVDQPGKRSNVADDFYWYGAVTALMSAGATFHSTAGITASSPGPLTRAAAAAFFAGLSAVPLDAQTWAYTRGPLPNCPLEHDDAMALRTFCKLGGADAVCVVIRPSPTWTAIPRNGWQITNVTGPRGSVLTLHR